MIRTEDGYEIVSKNIKIKDCFEEKKINEVKLGDFSLIYFKKEINETNTNKLTEKEILAYLFFNFNTTIKKNSVFLFQSIKNKRTEVLKKELENEIYNYKEDISDKNNKILFSVNETFLSKINNINKNCFLENRENAINLIYFLLKHFSYEKEQSIIINYDKKIIKFIQEIFLHFKIKTNRSKENLIISDKSTILRVIYTFDKNNDLMFRALASYLEQKYLYIATNNVFFYSKINYIKKENEL